jgi:hypothetical protein
MKAASISQMLTGGFFVDADRGEAVNGKREAMDI